MILWKQKRERNRDNKIMLYLELMSILWIIKILKENGLFRT